MILLWWILKSIFLKPTEEMFDKKKKNQHQLKGGKASRGQLAGDQVMVKFDVPVRGNKIFNQKRKIKNK